MSAKFPRWGGAGPFLARSLILKKFLLATPIKYKMDTPTGIVSVCMELSTKIKMRND